MRKLGNGDEKGTPFDYNFLDRVASVLNRYSLDEPAIIRTTTGSQLC